MTIGGARAFTVVRVGRGGYFLDIETLCVYAYLYWLIIISLYCTMGIYFWASTNHSVFLYLLSIWTCVCLILIWICVHIEFALIL